jgi:uncharacterized transporter YbjL
MEQYIIPAVVGLIGVIAGAWITSASQRIKVKAEADKTTADANEQIRQTVMNLIKPLQDKVEGLEIELQDWKNWASALVKQIKCLGHEPVPFKSSKEH